MGPQRNPSQKHPEPPKPNGHKVDPEALIDEALEETFPASDPISPAVGPGEPIEQR
ncbi:MAG TPA: hypothetical protein VMT54_11285 [Candidatus Cybelea sp.]|nr:hypothetical protein [Candidatus Cybelea sp.]